MLEVAEGNVGVEHVHGVNPDGFCPDLVRIAECRFDIPREHGGGKVVDGVIRLLDDVGLVLELDHHLQRPEDLLLHDGNVWLGVGEDRGRDEVALRADTVPAEVHRRPAACLSR